MSTVGRFIILLPIIFVLGGIYEHSVWLRLPMDLQVLTYLGPKARLLILLKPVLATSVAMSLFYLSRRSFLPRFRSETLILALWSAVSILVLLNPLILWAIANVLGMAPRS